MYLVAVAENIPVVLRDSNYSNNYEIRSQHGKISVYAGDAGNRHFLLKCSQLQQFRHVRMIPMLSLGPFLDNENKNEHVVKIVRCEVTNDPSFTALSNVIIKFSNRSVALAFVRQVKGFIGHRYDCSSFRRTEEKHIFNMLRRFHEDNNIHFINARKFYGRSSWFIDPSQKGASRYEISLKQIEHYIPNNELRNQVLSSATQAVQRTMLGLEKCSDRACEKSGQISNEHDDWATVSIYHRMNDWELLRRITQVGFSDPTLYAPYFEIPFDRPRLLTPSHSTSHQFSFAERCREPFWPNEWFQQLSQYHECRSRMMRLDAELLGPHVEVEVLIVYALDGPKQNHQNSYFTNMSECLMLSPMGIMENDAKMAVFETTLIRPVDGKARPVIVVLTESPVIMPLDNGVILRWVRLIELDQWIGYVPLKEIQWGLLARLVDKSQLKPLSNNFTNLCLQAYRRDLRDMSDSSTDSTDNSGESDESVSEGDALLPTSLMKKAFSVSRHIIADHYYIDETEQRYNVYFSVTNDEKLYVNFVAIPGPRRLNSRRMMQGTTRLILQNNVLTFNYSGRGNIRARRVWFDSHADALRFWRQFKGWAGSHAYPESLKPLELASRRLITDHDTEMKYHFYRKPWMTADDLLALTTTEQNDYGTILTPSSYEWLTEAINDVENKQDSLLNDESRFVEAFSKDNDTDIRYAVEHKILQAFKPVENCSPLFEDPLYAKPHPLRFGEILNGSLVNLKMNLNSIQTFEDWVFQEFITFHEEQQPQRHPRYQPCWCFRDGEGNNNNERVIEPILAMIPQEMIKRPLISAFMTTVIHLKDGAQEMFSACMVATEDSSPSNYRWVRIFLANCISGETEITKRYKAVDWVLVPKY